MIIKYLTQIEKKESEWNHFGWGWPMKLLLFVFRRHDDKMIAKVRVSHWFQLCFRIALKVVLFRLFFNLKWFLFIMKHLILNYKSNIFRNSFFHFNCICLYTNVAKETEIKLLKVYAWKARATYGRRRCSWRWQILLLIDFF